MDLGIKTQDEFIGPRTKLNLANLSCKSLRSVRGHQNLRIIISDCRYFGKHLTGYERAHYATLSKVLEDYEKMDWKEGENVT
jgi:hypothetical protein